MDTDNRKKDSDSKPLRSGYELRPRNMLKRPRRKLPDTQACFSFSSKSPKLSEQGKSARKCPERYSPSVNTEDVEMEDYSQQSVSMLQECYQQDDFPLLMETCMNSELEEVDIYSDGEIVEEPKSSRVENSTQTYFFSPQVNHTKDKELMAHAKFISYVVKLKAAISSKKAVSDRELWGIIGNSTGEKHSETDWQGQSVPKETVGYVLRSSNVDKVFNETVRVLLQHLENVLKKDISKIMFFWKNSIYETVVEMLSQAAVSEVGVWKMITSFLSRMIESILNDSQKSKNLVLEAKANIIVSICQSPRLIFSIINSLIENLTAIKRIKRHNEQSSSSQKLSWAYLTKNSYFLLRILESMLELLKSKLNGKKIEDAVVNKSEAKKYNILEMWRKNWGKSETEEELETGHEWEITVSEWCDKLDDILLHCVGHVPVLSLAVERCAESGKEILKLCHQNKMKS